MKPQSAKVKGRRLQQYVRDKLLELAPHLGQRDVTSTSMGAGGIDVKLSEAAYKVYPWDIECKNQEALNIWKAMEQAAEHGEGLPTLVFKRNRSGVYICFPFEAFLERYYGKKKAESI